MNFPNYFADAEASFKESNFVLFGIPYDKTGSFRRGTRKAPGAIRQASWNFESYDLLTGIDLKDIKIHDYGDLDIDINESSLRMKQKVKEFVTKVIKNKKMPLAIGGEHTVTLPVIDAIDEEKKDFCVVVFDAHLDFKDVYENNPESHACVVRRISEIIGVENIVILGARSGTKYEFEESKKQNLFFASSFEINNKGIDWAIRETLEKFKDKKIYLTLDIDVLDPAYAPGTSTPEPFGLSPFDVLNCIDRFSPQIIGFDIVEVCPPFDKGETALLAAKLLRFAIDRVWANKKA